LGARTTCLLADDHPALLDAVGRFLELHDVEVVHRARDGQDALTQVCRLHPDLALLDLVLPGLSGTETTRRIGREAPETAVVVYTGYAEAPHLLEALDAGARGFLSKDAPLEELVRAVEIVASGRTYVDASLAPSLVQLEALSIPQLTARERDVLRLLADGLRTDEVARRLYISPETVRTHLRKAMDKLEAETRTQAVAEALRQSIIC
jgi:DNA-binding NarL/FixJ family response regulator